QRACDNTGVPEAMSCPQCGAETMAGLLQCRVCRAALAPAGGYALSRVGAASDFDTTLPSLMTVEPTTGLPPAETTTGFPQIDTTTGFPVEIATTGFTGAGVPDTVTKETLLQPTDRTTLPP